MEQAATVQELKQFANNTTDSIEKNTTRGNSILKDRPSLRVDSIYGISCYLREKGNVWTKSPHIFVYLEQHLVILVT